MVNVHFTDFFGVNPEVLEQYGAFNVSLINDLPLFVDPFLLFNSDKSEYQDLHSAIIQYLRFLRDKSMAGGIREGLLHSWFTFPEVKQNWLGFSLIGNSGSGLGIKFARALHLNLNSIFANFGDEKITKSSHLEKLCLIEEGVGKDNISDFTTNLIKHYLLEFTQRFALNYLSRSQRRRVTVSKVHFNYQTETWVSEQFVLPYLYDDFVLLTPKDILTKDDTWINKNDLLRDFDDFVTSIPNDQLRSQLNNYLISILPDKPTRKERLEAIARVIRENPFLIEYFILLKEERGEQAVALSDLKVEETEDLFISQVAHFIDTLSQESKFYELTGDTVEETRKRILYLKDVIENKGGYRLFYLKGEPVRRETDLHILFRLTWFGTPSDVSAEVNDGRGPADFKISRGAWDKTIVEFKLATNRKLKQNLANQAEIYQRASNADAALKVIIYFSEAELEKLSAILEELLLTGHPNVVLIDARDDNKLRPQLPDNLDIYYYMKVVFHGRL